LHEQFDRAAINRIAADTTRDFSPTTLWPTYPDDSVPSANFHIYIGAAAFLATA
jgi:hypothetical protein